jgi:hypothetical protein
MRLPAELRNRLEPDVAQALDRLLVLVADGLAAVYREALTDHQESRGDDAQFFGFKVWKWLRYAVQQSVLEDEAIEFVDIRGAYHLQVGPLRIRVDALGHHADDDVLESFPDASPTKRAVGRNNAAQMQFDLPAVSLSPDAGAYALNNLTVGHFGNPREGLLKWYVGAWSELPDGRQAWQWIERQGLPEDARQAPPAPLVVSFGQRDADAVVVTPRRTA